MLAGAWLIARFVNHGFKRAIERHRQRGTLLPETATQMTLTRRLLNIAIWVTAAAIALSQFPALRVLSAGLLASPRLSGPIVGFSAPGALGDALPRPPLSGAQPPPLGDDPEIRHTRGAT